MRELDTLERKALYGDMGVLGILTVVGFATHQTLGDFGRMAVTMVTALVAWGIVAPTTGIYRREIITDPNALWRVPWAWLVAAPLATFLRGLILNKDIPPVFVLVVFLTNGVALVLWRLYVGWSEARSQSRVDTPVSSSTSRPS